MATSLDIVAEIFAKNYCSNYYQVLENSFWTSLWVRKELVKRCHDLRALIADKFAEGVLSIFLSLIEVFKNTCSSIFFVDPAKKEVEKLWDYNQQQQNMVLLLVKKIKMMRCFRYIQVQNVVNLKCRYIPILWLNNFNY